MLFLGGLLKLLEETSSQTINHFALIRLTLFSLDKALLYVLLLIGGQIVYFGLKWYRYRQVRIDWKKQFFLTGYVFYMILLIHLTALRYEWQWWHLVFHFEHSISDIALVPLLDTTKLVDGDSKFSFWYNFFGNVVWFIPFGWWTPFWFKKRHLFFQIVGWAILFSISIETTQFLLETGIAHIDDVIFNTMGAILGYCLYDMTHFVNYYLIKRRKESRCRS